MATSKKTTSSGVPTLLLTLWEEGFFTEPKSQSEVSEHLAGRGYNFQSDTLRKALFRGKHLTRSAKNGLTYVQTKPAINKETAKAQNALFETELIKRFGKSFETEIADLHHNFGKSGNCTAFILRKILEKLIYITFAKHGIEARLEDKHTPGRLIGLEGMINVAASEKIGGIPLLTSHTAQEVKGIKFLGDASAHNPLVEVDMKTIIPQLPYIITAYKELLR